MPLFLLYYMSVEVLFCLENVFAGFTFNFKTNNKSIFQDHIVDTNESVNSLELSFYTFSNSFISQSHLFSFHDLNNFQNNQYVSFIICLKVVVQYWKNWTNEKAQKKRVISVAKCVPAVSHGSVIVYNLKKDLAFSLSHSHTHTTETAGSSVALRWPNVLEQVVVEPRELLLLDALYRPAVLHGTQLGAQVVEPQHVGVWPVVAPLICCAQTKKKWKNEIDGYNRREVTRWPPVKRLVLSICVGF